MVIHNFHVQRVFALPAEANSPLVIDADAVLASAVVFQGFQVVAVRRAQVIQTPRLMQQQQFSSCRSLNLVRQAPRRFIVEQPLGFLAGEAAYHLRQL